MHSYTVSFLDVDEMLVEAMVRSESLVAKVRHDSCILLASFIHMCDMTLSTVGRDSFLGVVYRESAKDMLDRMLYTHTDLSQDATQYA